MRLLNRESRRRREGWSSAVSLGGPSLLTSPASGNSDSSITESAAHVTGEETDGVASSIGGRIQQTPFDSAQVISNFREHPKTPSALHPEKLTTTMSFVLASFESAFKKS